MKTSYYLLLTLLLPCCALAQTGQPWTDNFNTQRDPAIVEEARDFIIRRQGCDHFRGEYGEPGGEREAFIISRTTELCTGTDADLARLREKYADRPETIAALAEFEDCIEYDTKCTKQD